MDALKRPVSTLLAPVLLLLLLVAVSPAQDVGDTGPERDAAQVFDRARNALESGNISISALEELRSQLAAARAANAAIISRGSVEARALQAQLDALGPPPAEGATEAEGVAARRGELNAAIAVANAPIREAQERQKRAEFLIGELDAAIRRQQTTKLLVRYPTPLAPSSWASAWHDLWRYAQRLKSDTAIELQSPSVSSHLRESLPVALLLLTVGLATLLFVQRPVARRLTLAAEKRRSGVSRWLFAIIHNLSYAVIPAIGAIALLLVIPLLDIRPSAARQLLQLAPFMAASLIVAHWLGNTLFSPSVPGIRLFSVSDEEARTGVRLCQGLGLFLVAELILEILENNRLVGEAAVSALSLPVILFAAFLLWKLAGLLRMESDGPREPAVATGDDAARQNESGFLTVLSFLMRASAVVAAILVAVGFVKLSRETIIPMILTIALLGFAIFLFHLVIDIYRSMFRLKAEEGHPILLSIGAVLILGLALAPLIAMVWGARPTDIAEVWRLLTEGVQLGDIRLSLNVIITLAVVFASGALLTRWIQRTLQTSVLPRTRMDMGAQTAVLTGIGYLGLTLAGLIAVSTAGLNLSSLAVVAGALSVGIGFGLQTIVSNFVSGIILLVERPIKEGDWIEVSGHSGFVRKISVRSTRIETFDRHDVIIPNSDLISGAVKNMTLTSKSGRLIVPVGVAYGSDLEKARTIMLDAAKAHDAISAYPEPVVLFIELADSSVNFELRCYLKDIANILVARSDLLFTIYSELGKAGVEIPFPQRDLHLKDIDRLVTALESLRPTADAGAKP